ncbi:MAG: FAD-binding oxidoreductase [Chlorobi bacterium]|nr:FAD-binding oxidoreductase [Chlorobiota bacterium]
MTTDFLVVGFGIAGWAFTEILRREGHDYRVFDPGGSNSTTVSAGMYNPVILKRLTLAWKAPEWLPYALDTYRRFEERHGIRLVYPAPIHRKFHSVAEQNEWLAAAGRPVFEDFLGNIRTEPLPGVPAPYGFGLTKQTGMVDTSLLLSRAREELESEGRLIPRFFRHERLQITPGGVRYEGLEARFVVFAEGYGLVRNPFFNWLPLRGTKGEVLELELDPSPGAIVKSDIFLAPRPGGKGWLAGSTYEWYDKTPRPTARARARLTAKLRKLYTGDFRITGQRAGIRPTVADRRPLLGAHPEYPSLYVLNGMGTRGIILAPRAARDLYEHITRNAPLLPETDIGRFRKRYDRSRQ